MQDNHELREQLKQLHKDLEKAGHQQPLEKDLLSHVMTDLVRVASGEELHPDVGENLVEKIEHQASDFDVKHPQMATILREIMDILSKLGI